MGKLQVYDKTTGKWADVVDDLVYHGCDDSGERHYYTGRAVRPETGMVERFAMTANAWEAQKLIDRYGLTGGMNEERVFILFFIKAGLLRDDEADHDER